MQFKPHNVREDAPPAADEIEVHHGNLAQAPRRLKESSAVQSLRAVTEEQAQLEADIAAKRAELESRRAAALAIQDSLEAQLAEEAALATLIPKARADLDLHHSKICEYEEWTQGHWQEPLADLIEDFVRRDFLVHRLPRYIEAMTVRLQQVREQLAAFRLEHGIEEFPARSQSAGNGAP